MTRSGMTTIRLKDVATRTGFSVNTVSLALRDSPRLAKETREIIRSAARELNYLPNQVAKSLVNRETKTIGLILTDITSPILTATAQSVETALSARGYSTLFATSNNRIEDEMKAIDLFRARQVDGMLVYPRSHTVIDHIQTLRGADYPVVLLVANGGAEIDAVGIDERKGSYKAVTHLIDVGHRAIALIDSANPLGNPEKREGYLLALDQAGIAFDPSLVSDPGGHSVARGFWAMDALMSRTNKPTAVFTANDALALGVLRWTKVHGLRVPEDLAIIGFDNIEYAEHATTPISSVNYDVALVTDLAVERLMNLIASPGALPSPQMTLIDPDIVVRQSTAKRTR
ncbi:LacI family DNA-binding transcriptional regulator [Roseinatronobacter sp. S2]|uniref:LacI family DNA-binding transcriptional regulator n=1 Tax=Roseinatronobacter sp. S2 TaxID=3035471 RepID=UPI00240FE025|nr:LacI family DNA-binding transcriptional regulator [Roseinatronobacter sp. S2]WFE74775.1 LacI family DNA-binding transcriptional regulator [Roseinatronobacter sp. S2]